MPVVGLRGYAVHIPLDVAVGARQALGLPRPETRLAGMVTWPAGVYNTGIVGSPIEVGQDICG